jgi:predicted O-methyltransferase YrrM
MQAYTITLSRREYAMTNTNVPAQEEAIMERGGHISQTQIPQELYAILMQELPKFHCAYDGTTATESAAYNWGLHPAVLQWLIDHVRPGFRTLETGCGYSTVVFALYGCRHTVVSPFPEEHRCIDEWCRKHGVSVETVAYHCGPSQRVLPALKPMPLDLVIIDGDHAVPTPLIDFYYTSDWLVKDGLLLVDDIQLPSVQQLYDFLDTEKPRWTFVKQIARTRIYRKRVEGNVTGLQWMQQPFCTTELSKSELFYLGLRKFLRILVR